MAEIGPIHHPDEDVLLDYAAGKASQATSVLVATHLALCPSCRAEVRKFEALGGALIEAEKLATMSADALTAVLSRLDDSEEDEVRPVERCDAQTLALIPQPLRGYLGSGVDSLPWKTRGIGIREAVLDFGDPAIRTSLVRIAPGARVLGHTHGDLETTMVLKGAFNDSTGRYARGDVVVATSDLDHAPVAETGEECICMIIVEGGLRFTGPLSRLMNPFVRL